MKDQKSCISIFVACSIFVIFQVATRSTSPDMTTVFHTWPSSRFIEIQSNLRRKKLHETNQGSNFLGGSCSNRDNVRSQSNLEEKVNHSILKDYFSSRTDPSIFTSTAPVFLDQSNTISCIFPALKSTSHMQSQSAVSRRSDSISEANSTCCHRSDT